MTVFQIDVQIESTQALVLILMKDRGTKFSDAQRLFFFQNVYSPTLNGTTRVVHALSNCPYRFLANTFIPIVFWVYIT